MCEDTLEGRITGELYDRKAKELRGQAAGLIRKANEVRTATPAPVQEAIDLMDLTSRTGGEDQGRSEITRSRAGCLIFAIAGT